MRQLYPLGKSDFIVAIIVGVVLIGSSSSLLFAQDGGAVGAQMQGSARILWNLELEGVQDLVFDQIIAGTPKEIDVDGSVFGQEATGNEQIGVFRVATKEAINFQFNDLPNSMVNKLGFRMPVTFSLAWGVNRQGTDVTRLNPNEPITIPADEQREYVYLFLGAAVDPSEDQPEGEYEIDLRITVIYGS